MSDILTGDSTMTAREAAVWLRQLAGLLDHDPGEVDMEASYFSHELGLAQGRPEDGWRRHMRTGRHSVVVHLTYIRQSEADAYDAEMAKCAVPPVEDAA